MNEVFGNSAARYRPTEADNRALIDAGWYTPTSHGLSPDDKLLSLLINRPPGWNVEQTLQAVGIDVEHMGYQRLRSLKQTVSETSTKGWAREQVYSDELLSRIRSNPFVQSASSKQIRFMKSLYSLGAKFINFFATSEILNIFGLGENLLPVSVQLRLRYEFLKAKPCSLQSAQLDQSSPEYLPFLIRYREALEKLTDAQFDRIQAGLTGRCTSVFREVCLLLHSMPGGEYGMTVTERIRKCGLNRSRYYAALKNPDYGKSIIEKQRKDAADVEKLKTVIGYKGYPKGYRQVAMQLERHGFEKMNHKKVARLMKQFGLQCSVRKPNPAAVNLRKDIAEHTQPNRLKRRFRLHRPLEVFLTDVTYLDYGPGQRAYLSVIKDSVSGRIMAAFASESQNLQLGRKTLAALKPYAPCLLHSDQGALYLSDNYQRLAKSMEIQLSMSRRGNCWDNASQESFFGHFKDECSYQQLENLNELQAAVCEYVQYYNEQRPQYSRNRMTPVEYEAWLLNMDDHQWKQWLFDQQLQYDQMVENARQAAIERARIDKEIE